VREGPTGEGDGSRTWVAAVLDVETTGRDTQLDEVIELAVRRVRFDAEGIITKVDSARSWLEQPSSSLRPDVIEITGLTDEILAGCRIDEREVLTLLEPSYLVVSHNARFDRPFVERRLAELPRKRWACSMADVDWPALGFDGRKLGHLLMQCGYFHDPHRATGDVDAVIGLLRHRLPDGRTVLRELLSNASMPHWIVRAYGAAFEAKGLLHGRGYRWNHLDRHWMREVSDREIDEERAWLQEQVYCERMRPRAPAPWIGRLPWTERFRS
jgi:DNA polymerase-3 subunit epsilon